MTSADGPSRAGPISDRVVKPDALHEDWSKMSKAPFNKPPTLDQDQRHTMLELASTETQVCWVYWKPWWSFENMLSDRVLSPFGDCVAPAAILAALELVVV